MGERFRPSPAMSNAAAVSGTLDSFAVLADLVRRTVEEWSPLFVIAADDTATWFLHNFCWARRDDSAFRKVVNLVATRSACTDRRVRRGLTSKASSKLVTTFIVLPPVRASADSASIRSLYPPGERVFQRCLHAMTTNALTVRTILYPSRVQPRPHRLLPCGEW